MPDDAANPLAFDAFLDALVGGGAGDAGELDRDIVATARRVHATTLAPHPDGSFARDLRRSLLARADTAPIGMRAVPGHRATPVPAAGSWTRGRWWPRMEVAAMVILILVLVGSLIGRDGIVSWRDNAGSGGRIPAPSALVASTPVASPPAADHSTTGPVSILFVADVSGSMSYDPLGGTTKIEMEKEALRQAIGMLADGDEVGILVFNDRQTWAVRMTTIDGRASRDRIDAAIGGISADGGTEIYSALSVGFDAIAKSDADVRHVLLLSDGKSRTGSIDSYRQLVEDGVAGGITLSTVAIGDDADTALLSLLATIGNGRSYTATRTADIPVATAQDVAFVTGRVQATPAAGEGSVAVLFLVDTSGSMSDQPTGETSKLEWEKETLRRTIAALPDGATIGIMDLDERADWIVPRTTIGVATSAGDRRRIVAAVDAIEPKGNSFLTSALLALTRPAQVDPLQGINQVILLSDGKFNDHDMQAYRAVIEPILTRREITFSTIAYGTDADTATLQTLAEYGKGRYHLVESPADIPTLTVSQDHLSLEEGVATPSA
jgi:Mg-chelatase subunit ChlD